VIHPQMNPNSRKQDQAVGLSAPPLATYLRSETQREWVPIWHQIAVRFEVALSRNSSYLECHLCDTRP
jgi:hypothetical protein